MYFIGGAFLWLIALCASLLLWAFRIRGYLAHNGRCRGDGANIGWAILADASIASDIAHANGKYPLFLRIFWVTEVLIWLLPIMGLIGLAIR